MTDSERRAILTIAIHAAFVDGATDDREREQIRRVADGLAGDGAAALPSAYQAVLVERQPLEVPVSALGSPELRRLAYEMAVAVAESDGVRTPAERVFLDRLRGLLGVEEGRAAALERETEALLTTPVAGTGPGTGTASPPAGAPPGVSAPVAPGAAEAAALETKILNYAILNGALELLPESIATMAIIPLQMKLVVEVGQAHGYALDRGHVTELLATVGLGVTGQAVEQVGRRILGGLLGALGGRMLGGLGRQAVSSGMAFATTYAIGQVAREYYASGRRIDAAQLRAVFERMLEQARGLAGTYSDRIAEKARTLDVSSIASLVRRGPG